MYILGLVIWFSIWYWCFLYILMVRHISMEIFTLGFLHQWSLCIFRSGIWFLNDTGFQPKWPAFWTCGHSTLILFTRSETQYNGVNERHCQNFDKRDHLENRNMNISSHSALAQYTSSLTLGWFWTHWDSLHIVSVRMESHSTSTRCAPDKISQTDYTYFTYRTYMIHTDYSYF
jgi:hypothetical protein